MSTELGVRVAVSAKDLFATTFDVLEPRATLGLSFDASGFTAAADFTRLFNYDFD